MSKKLVLQGPQATQAALAQIAALARPARTTEVHAHALRCDGFDFTPELQATIGAAADAAGIDATFVDADLTLADFKLVAMDMDSTLITIECIDEIADMQGLKPQVSAITEAAMRGELDFSESLTRRVALLEGLPTSALERVYEERLRISLGGEAMLQAVQAAGLKTLLVSGGFTFFTERLQARLGIDFTLANVLDVADGRLTGRMRGDIVDADAKATRFAQLARSCASDGISVAIGDGANDVPMLGRADVSVAYRAKPRVRAKAMHAIDHCGLDAMLNLFS